MSYKGKINVYICPSGHQTITVDIDEGTTPFMLRCRHQAKPHNCNEMARSSFYNVDQNLVPEYEWFKPVSLKGYSEGMKEHIKMGGLEIRKIKPQQ